MSFLRDKATDKISVLFHIVVMFALGIIVSLLPPFGAITPLGMKVLGVFVMVIYGWIFLDILWTSVAGFVFLTFSGVTTVEGAFAEAFSNSIMATIIVTNVIAMGLESMGIGDKIAAKFLTKKALTSRPWILVLVLCLVGFITSMLQNGLLGAILLWSVVTRAGVICGYEPKGKEISFINLLVAYCALMPISFAPYSPTMPFYGGLLMKATGITTLAMGQLFVIGMIVFVLTILVLVLVGKYIIKIDLSKFNLPEDTQEEFKKIKMDKISIIALSSFVIFILMVLSPFFVPDTFPGLSIIKALGIPGWGIIYLCFLVLLKKADGTPALTLEKAFARLPWSIVMLFAITVPLGSAMSSADVGVSATMAAFVAPIIGGLGVFGIYVFTYVFLALMTQVLHNMVVAIVLIPLIAPVAISVGANPMVLLFIMLAALSNAYATPAASLFSGIVFGCDQIESKHAYLWGTICMIVMAIVTIALIPMMNLILGA